MFIVLKGMNNHKSNAIISSIFISGRRDLHVRFKLGIITKSGLNYYDIP